MEDKLAAGKVNGFERTDIYGGRVIRGERVVGETQWREGSVEDKMEMRGYDVKKDVFSGMEKQILGGEVK